MESPAESPAASESGLTPAQERARRQRERRNAKIQAGGSARLDSITTLSGRPAPAADSPPLSASQASKASDSAQAADPDEVDISQHDYPKASRTASSSLDAFSTQGGRAPSPRMFPGMGAPPGDTADTNEDPMMQMLQQMLGDPNDPQSGEMGGLPPGLAQLLGTAMGGQKQQQAQQQKPASSSAYMWRIIHFLFAFSLAVYVAVAGKFSGSKVARVQSEGLQEEDWEAGRRLFWMFVTAELVLQSTRYFAEKGQLAQSGLLGKLAQMLPEPYAGYVKVVGRYGVIYSTIMADAMVIMFVLGAMAWWKGEAAS